MGRRRTTAAVACATLAVAAGVGASGAATAPKAATPVSILVGTWAWRDLDEGLAATAAPVSVRITTSSKRPVLIFPGQRPVRGRWIGARNRLVVTATRRLSGSKKTARVRYVLRATTGGGRVRLAGRLAILNPKFPGSSAVTALLVARPT